MQRKHIYLGIFLVLLAIGCSTPVPRSADEGQAYPAEEYKPGVPGEVRTFTLSNGNTFTATVKGDTVVVEGDIVLGTVDQVESLVARGLHPLSNSCDYSEDDCDRWPNRIVYFEINSDDARFRNKVLGGIRMIEAKTNLRFVPRDSGERIVFNKVTDGTCAAEIGNNMAWWSGVPDVWCDLSYPTGSFAHETLHALGYAHEQGRDDRDDYVRILWDNIRDDGKSNFEKSDSWLDNFFPIGPYDYDSIMQYPCWAFQKPGAGNTIEPLDPSVGCDRLGQRDGLSDGDVLGVLYIYRPLLSLDMSATRSRDTWFTAIALGRDDRETRAITPHVKFFFDGVPVARTGMEGGQNVMTLKAWEFAAGPHEVRADVTISGETVASVTGTVVFENVAPTIGITQPVSTGPYCQNETITLRALASDVDTAPYFGSGNVNGRIDWIYDRDPSDALAGLQFATNTETTSYTLSDTGTVRFIARVDDPDGAVATDSIDLTVQPCTNTPPQVAITNPSGDLNVWTNGSDENGRYYQITLAGTATDAEDGPLTGRWYTDRGDAQPGGPASGSQLLGNGNSLTVKLYANGSDPVTVHVISFVVTDSDGNTRIATVHITVNQLI